MESATQSLVGSVGQLLGAEYQLLRGVGGEVAELRDDLDTMNALLIMQSQAEDGAVDQFARVWMKQLRELAYDSEDCVDHYKLRIRCRSDGNARAWLMHHIKTLSLRHHLAGEISALRARAVAISERHARYGVSRGALSFSSSSSSHPVQWKFASAHAFRRANDYEQHQLIGIKGQVDTLVEKMKMDPVDGEQHLTVFSIVGFGGLGKTTLAMEVCRRLKGVFRCQAMVSVSQEFEPRRDLKALLKRLVVQVVTAKKDDEKALLKQIEHLADQTFASNLMDFIMDREEEALVSLEDKDNEVAAIKKKEELLKKIEDMEDKTLSANILQYIEDKKAKGKTVKKGKEKNSLKELDGLDDIGKLAQFLKDKRYLIVIDDVWTIRAWEAIRSLLPDNKCGSRIIVTTRIENVAKACSPATATGDYTYHIKPLDLEDSKKLFLSKVFGSMEASCPKELNLVMAKILTKCGGLPLAIVSIASVLAFDMSSEAEVKWETICRSIGSQMESNPTLEGMRQILTLSYNHLPHELKGCMMYLSIFPQDHEINTHRLLCRWIAEGLVLEKRGLTQMEVAESYLDELLSRNMITPASFNVGGRMKSCLVHGMFLEVMVSKSLESNIVSLLGRQYAGMSYDRIRRLSIQGNDKGGNSMEQERQTDLSSKKNMVVGGTEGMDVQHIRSLSLFQHNGKKLLDDLEKFTLLRVLDLEGSEGLTDRHMRYVCRLYLLRFLSVKGTTVSMLPHQVGKLEHLQTLDVSDTRLVGLPETITNLEKLERLMSSHRHRSHDRYEAVWKLPKGVNKMRALREVDMGFLGNDVQVVQEAGELEQLQKLGISLGDYIPFEELGVSLSKMCTLQHLNISSSDDGKSALNFLHRLHIPPRLLRYLRMAGMIQEIPCWVGSLTYLTEFEIHGPYGARNDPFDTLCMLPSLKSIVIRGFYYGGNEMVARPSHFLSLTHLIVVPKNENPKIFRFEEGSMPNLEALLLGFGYTNRSIIGVEHLASLKKVQLTGGKYNTALERALERLNAESRRRRPESNQFQVKYV